MAASWPTRGQKAPQYWDQQVKDYIDEAVTAERVAATLEQEPVKSDLSNQYAASVAPGGSARQTVQGIALVNSLIFGG